MRFTLYGGSIEEETAIRRFAKRLGAGFARYEALKEGEEPLLAVQCLPRKTGLLEALEQVTRWMDRGTPPERAMDAQSPLPGLGTPPCR